MTMADRLRRDWRARRRLASSSASRSSVSVSMNSFTNVGCMMPPPGSAAMLVACRALHRVEDRARPLIHSGSPLCRVSGMTAQWLAEWQKVLARGADAVFAALTSPSLHAAELRQNSPFAGVLSEQERTAALEAFGNHWRQAHAA